jgi:CHRD domain
MFFYGRRRKEMHKIHFSLLTVLALLVFTSSVSASPIESKNFVAVLSGAGEVPARDTNARGAAVFNLSDDGTTLRYKLIVANIDNAFASHIHCAPAGVNGPIGVTLFLGTPGSGRLDGVIARGTRTAPDPGNACGWTTLDDALAAMRSGNAYVNVHTNDGVDPTNTGPGDFPGGEIRGQIFEAGPTK